MSTPLRPRSSREVGAGKRGVSRRRHLARVDVAIGVVGALVIVLATPGLAIAAVIALVVLLLCAISLAVERTLARRRARPGNEEREAQ